jgi:acyl dehydratase
MTDSRDIQAGAASPDHDHIRGLYFEDLHEGDVFLSAGRTVTEADVVGFAGVSGDFNSIHLDVESTQSNRYGRRVAHGLLGLSMATGLLDRMAIFHRSMIAMLSINDWTFKAPLFIGDTIHLELTILSTRMTSKRDSGIVVRQMRLLNQEKTVVQEGTITVMIARRPGAAEAESTPNHSSEA